MIVELEYHGLRKIISGGQDGVDRGALHAAKDFGVDTGGWCPKDFRTAHGLDTSLQDLYKLQAHSSKEYPPRTEKNVIDSDGTLIIASVVTSPGTALTLKYIHRHGKPYFIFEIPKTKYSEAIDVLTPSIANWIVGNSIEVLNVAGNHKNPEFHHMVTWEVVTNILAKLYNNGKLRKLI